MHALTILATESEEHSLNVGLSYGIGFLTLGILMGLLFALLAFGGGREHS